MRATIAARSTSNAMHAEPQPAMAPLLAPGAEDAPFLRLWHGFLTGRVMVALLLLLAYVGSRFALEVVLGRAA